MKIVSITVARNESDVIEMFVRHHSHLVDEMLIVDHQSSDSTLEILQALRTEGAPLEIAQESRPELQQARTMTDLMRRAVREFDADWVIPLDADEFLRPSSRGPLRPLLERLDPALLHRVPWVTYIPRAEDMDGSKPLFERIQHRRSFEPVPYYKVVVPRSIAGRDHTSLRIGNHQLIERIGSSKRKLPQHDIPGLQLAHFPVRSPEQLAMKVLVGWPARLASSEQRDEQNWHLRSMFHAIRDGRGLTARDVMRFAAEYCVPREYAGELPGLVHDAMKYSGESLKLHHETTLDPLSAVAHLTELLAAELGELRRPRPRRIERLLHRLAYPMRKWRRLR